MASLYLSGLYKFTLNPIEGYHLFINIDFIRFMLTNGKKKEFIDRHYNSLTVKNYYYHHVLFSN